MEHEGSSGKRPYLRPAERRRQLLDAAGAVVEREGLYGLTMVAVTAEAGVSRRLLYNHFPDLATLVRAYVADRLLVFMHDTDDLFESGERSRVEIGRALFARLIAIPRADRLLVRTLIAGAAPPELAEVRELVEDRMAERWRRISSHAEDRSSIDSRLMLVAQVAFALADFLDRGRLTEEQVDELVVEYSNMLPK